MCVSKNLHGDIGLQTDRHAYHNNPLCFWEGRSELSIEIVLSKFH